MKRHHTGSGRRQVIPDDWTSHHTTVVLGMLRGLVSIREPGSDGETWSDEKEQMVAVPKTPYATAVAARVLALSGQARVLQLADDTEVVADYLVVIPADQVVAGGHLVEVTDSEDPSLNGRTLRVEKVAMGTERFARDLFCTLDD